MLGGVARFAAEAPWAWRVARRFARISGAERVIEIPGRVPVIADAEGDSPCVVVWADPEAYLAPRAARRLVDTLDGDPGAQIALPVSNEAAHDLLRRPPPFAYATPSGLEEAAAAAAESARSPFAIEGMPFPVFAVRRSALAILPPELPLERVPEACARAGGVTLAEPRAYLHRYAEMDAQARADLAQRIPEGARSVLDVGCSRGATAPALRARGIERIVGIEPDAGDAAGAAEVYDRVIPTALEKVDPGEFRTEFDAVLFGDVLEHLADPSEALARVRPWLSPRGVVVASVPNVGHWAVVGDLLGGRFDYVPYSLLSGTHVRHFTRATLADLFEASGYAVDGIEGVVLPRSADGEAKLARLASLPGASPDLVVGEFVVVARPA